LRAEDGHYVSGIHEIIHGKSDKANFFVDARSMYFDSYGIVYMALNNLKTDKGLTDNSIGDFAPKVAVAAFNSNTD